MSLCAWQGKTIREGKKIDKSQSRKFLLMNYDPVPETRVVPSPHFTYRLSLRSLALESGLSKIRSVGSTKQLTNRKGQVPDTVRGTEHAWWGKGKEPDNANYSIASSSTPDYVRKAFIKNESTRIHFRHRIEELNNSRNTIMQYYILSIFIIFLHCISFVLLSHQQILSNFQKKPSISTH